MLKSHPCFNTSAIHKFARIHLPVAPACNVLCNFCNRRFDCINENRPGVSSRILTPEEASQRVILTKAKIPELKVVGIAGPGDPLANPEATFQTFRFVAEHFPDMTLCLSTNGLLLEDLADQIFEVGVQAVTLTINALNLPVLEDIYQFITYKGITFVGQGAAEMLAEKQRRAMEVLDHQGMSFKVNTVLIPGVNEVEIEEIARLAAHHHALLHNILPFIPVEDTFFSRQGVLAPSFNELEIARKKASGHLSVMRHCRQCRADAVGFLFEDQCHRVDLLQFQGSGSDATLSSNLGDRPSPPATPSFKVTPGSTSVVRIAVATQSGEVVDLHFGKADQFEIWEYDLNLNVGQKIDVRKVERQYLGMLTCSEDPTWLPRIVNILGDCQALLCLNIGPRPLNFLCESGLKVYQVYDGIGNALREVSEEIFSKS